MSAFNQLAPFIQDYIYRNRWEELRDIQVASIDIILNTDNHLLLSSGTASGKTEAAFLPILTDLSQHPSSSVGILYISPLKALINDQFERLSDLLIEADIPVYKWHGDVSVSHKNKLRKNPKGLLQITPESLEAMLTYRKQEAILFFSDLRYVVIDEVHYFMGENRGIQLLSLLERLSRLTNCLPRRIGLSATVGNSLEVADWLASGTNRKCVVPQVDGGKRTIHLSIDDAVVETDFYDKLYHLSFGKRCIIFSNSRSEVELNIANLKLLAAKKQTPDIYFTHHGNVSGGLREYAEREMRTSDYKTVVGATVTLELGIDVGDLERIIETGTPYSVSSFVQRLGRSGRRTGISEMMFLFDKKDQDDTEQKNKEFYQQIDWDMILCIALIELYTKEKWIEPLLTPRLPYPLLYHQTMCYLTSVGSASPSSLAEYMLTLSPFRQISQEDYRDLLHYLLEIDQLEMDEEGNLLIGEKGSQTISKYQFLTVFENEIEYSVREESREIGTINTLVPVGETLILAGNSWRVLEINAEKRQIFVKKIKGISKSYWEGPDEIIIATKILKKMKEILSSKDSYPYLRANAKNLLEKSRQLFCNATLDHEHIVLLSDHYYALFPYLGTKSLMTLQLVLGFHGIVSHIESIYRIPIFLHIDQEISKEELIQVLNTIKQEPLDPFQLEIGDLVIQEKNIQYVPKHLSKKHYLTDYIEVEAMRRDLEF